MATSSTAISSTGIGSGLDVSSLVTKLMSIERQPETLMDSKTADFKAKLSAYGQVSSGYMNLGNAQGIPGPSFEAVIEFTHSIRLAPAIALQPDVQYVLHPGGSRQNGNALVVGFRAIVDF